MTNRIGRSRSGVAAVSAVLLGLLGAAALARADDDLAAAEPPDDSSDRFFRITASTGVDFSTGDFGSNTDSDSWYLPTALKIEWDPIFFKITVPYVIVDGDVVLIDGQPEGDGRVGGAGDGRESGIGDVVVSAGYGYFPTEGVLPVVELTGKIKFGTADEDEGLGTGEEDYTLQVDVSKRFGRFTPFATLGYKFLGDPPGTRLDDKLFASLGASVSLAKRVSLGLAYDWAQSAVSGRPDIQEFSPFASFKLGKHFAVDPYAVIGTTSASPDWGVGLQLRAFWEPR